MLIAVEGPKLEDTEGSAATCWACTEFCSRHGRQNFNWICEGFLLKYHSVSVYSITFDGILLTRCSDCVCCTQVLKSVRDIAVSSWI